MASVNKVIIVGNLGADPETRYLPSGDAVSNITVATTDKWTDKASGEKREQVEWHRIAFFGRLAEVCGEYLKKGSQVYVEGSIHTKKYTDKDGVEKYSTSIKGQSMQMLGSRPDSVDRPERAERNPTYAKAAPKQDSGSIDDMPDDIPFASCSLADDVTWKQLRWKAE